MSAQSQSLLEKKISIKTVNQPIDETLQQIGNLGGFSFSYSPDLINVKEKTSVQAANLSVREILNQIFKGKVTFKERRKYIILQPNASPDEPKEPENFDLNGYIIDERTGQKLANASIYESVTLASTVSNQYGYYKIRLPTAQVRIRLEVRKEDYIGKSIPISKKENAYLQINLQQDTLKPIAGLKSGIAMPIDSSLSRISVPEVQIASNPTFSLDPKDTTLAGIASLGYDRWKKTYKMVHNEFVEAFASAKQAIHTRNITDTLHQPFQASVLPFLGTNHELSGNIINDYSINLIAGYSLGVNKLEVGSVLNVVRGNVNGFQLAGVSNVVGGNVNGFQYANFVNMTLGQVRGFQGTNVINYIGGDLDGFQLAGVGNVVVGNLSGYQFSLGYNYAHTVRQGHQIGAINYADSSAKVPFGLFSFVRKNGYRRYEFSTDEFSYFSTAFKTGVTRFYNVFLLTFNGTASHRPLGSVGYGFGTGQNLGKSWTVNADLTGSLFVRQRATLRDPGFGVARFSITMEKKFGRRFALFAGPSVSIADIREKETIDAGVYKSFKPAPVGNPETVPNPQVYGWFGFQAGIRFCNKI